MMIIFVFFDYGLIRFVLLKKFCYFIVLIVYNMWILINYWSYCDGMVGYELIVYDFYEFIFLYYVFFCLIVEIILVVIVLNIGVNE